MSSENNQSTERKVSPLQWAIILVLSMGMLFGFYVGCGSNRVGVTMELPSDAPAQSTAPAAQNQ